MCGIAGYIGRFSLEQLARANASLTHRGPDAQGIWQGIDEGVGLAHRRLSIIDVSDRGAQPMLTEDEGVVLVFNGEIFNFADLRQQLEASGHTFRGHSDTEVLLKLYVQYG